VLDAKPTCVQGSSTYGGAAYTTHGRSTFAVTLSPAGDDVRWVTVRSARRDVRIVIPVR
jgi:hypothetical protein